MVATLDHINEHQQALFDETISRIVATLNPVKIICYGNRTHHDGMWSCFLPSPSARIYTDYDLFIITPASQPEKEHELLDKLGKCEMETVRVTAVIHTVFSVKEELIKGNTFFVTVCQNGLAVYDGDKSSSLILPSIKGAAGTIEKIDEHWSKWFGLAERFYGTAVDCATNERGDIAVFMLHQTVESACIAVIRIQTGYRPATHNLKRLLALMENFTLHGLVIFPRITKEETELFNILHRAYSDVRYKEEYKISGDTVFILIERVKSLLDVAEEIYQGKKTWLQSTSASDQINTQELSPFESICIDIFADVILQKGESESIRIECNKDVSNMIKTSVENKRLWISTNTGGPEIFPDATLHITYASLNGLVVNQSGKVTCKEPIETLWLGIVQNSNGNINLELNVTTLDITINKAGNVTISGSADEARIVTYGSGNLDGSKLVTTSASVVISGSGNASIHVDEDLSGELSGSGNLLYKGLPRLKSLSIKGTGGLKPL